MRDWLRSRGDKTYKLWGILTQQTPSALHWMDKLIKDIGVAGVVEIGTAYGGTSAWLGACLPDRVTTLDVVDKRPAKAVDLHKRLGVSMVIGDALSPNVTAFLGRHLWHKTADVIMILCDGGNKLEEWRLYRDFLRVGDLILVHDNGIEFPADGLEKEAVDAGLERIYKNELDNDGTLLAAYRKVA
jgi:predicted O-methyltransferase YrrM